ncbi:minor capsid protein [Convivina praedatoris]|uniref:Phage head morphogenesis domain-containing protein n=1 Tax=Convivina praedatoris TaxID=2880963 RepID=A0ABN8HF61_9LACO|nr:minor capsid protein [Convivina sp. LMG 32447]CAH1857367.1 hypothetical protein LMG032447_01511 [Convivina sp. LMG 32447]
MNNRYEAFQFSKRQIKQDAKNAKLIDKIVKQQSLEFLAWWSLFQSKYPDFQQSDNSRAPDPELMSELNVYATKNGMNQVHVSNVDQMIEYATLLFTSIIALKSIRVVNQALRLDAKQTAEFGNKIYKQTAKAVGDEIINKTYDGMTWSSRIWSNQAQLRSDISRIMRQALLNENPMSATKELRDKFGVVKYQAERILRTEGARVSAAQQARNIKMAGYDKMEWVASPGACRFCLENDGKQFKADKFGSGRYTIPRHPNCRCAVVAVDSGEIYAD